MFKVFLLMTVFTLPATAKVLHIGCYYKIRAFEYKQTSPSIALRDQAGKTYYISLGHDCGHVKVKDSSGRTLTMCNEIEPEYTRLEYLESDGYQCIDTGIIPTGTTSFEIKTYVAAPAATSTGQVPIGTRTHINNTEWYYQVSTYNKYPTGYIGYGPNSSQKNANLIFQDINTILFTSGKYTINNNYTHQYDLIEFPAEFKNSIYMFCLNSKGSGTAVPDHFTGKIYYVKIWDDGKLLRDYIPVLDPSGTPAMFDRVSCQYFYNHADGQFKYSIAQ
ncbi:hypothetical protein HDR61_01215 [bacterium]|nr:hypothetical protein [bacterium]